jgi:DNA polymerase-1
MDADDRLFVIDTMPLLYRGHFVFLRNPRLTSGGMNTSALYGFVTTLMQVIDGHRPTHLALVLDSTTPTFRHREYPAYKAQRQKMPEDIGAAIPMVIELAQALRIPILRVEGFEADDLLGTLAEQAGKSGATTYLVTPDKDVAQLVNATTFLFRPGKASAPPEILGVDDVCRAWGLSRPSQMVDYLGLAGDASDNIPGIDGVGDKTAVALLQQFGTLESVLEHAGELKGKLAERVASGREQALVSRHLATIRRDVPLAVALDDLRRVEPDPDVLRGVLGKYELVQLGQRLLGEHVASAPGRTFRTIRDTPHDYRCVQDEDALSGLLSALTAAPEWAFDTETTGLDAWHVRLVGLSFATAPGRAWYVPVPEAPAARDSLLDLFRPHFADAVKPKIGHNLKYDLTVLRQHGLHVAGPLHDSMLAHYVYDAAERHGMDHLARLFLDYDPIPITDLIGAKGADQKNMGQLAPGQIADYAAEDADVTLQLYHTLRPQVVACEGLRALEICEEPLVQVLVDMEGEGVRIDPAVLVEYGRELEGDLRVLEAKIRALAAVAGPDAAATADASAGELALDGEATSHVALNLASPKQMGELLFDRLKLDPDAKRTASGQYATDEDTLQKLAGRHPIIDLILEHRACSKLKSTYVDKLPECIDAATGRIHTTFSQALTETGRLSSSNPNLQNIPIRTDRGRRIRAAFVPRDADHVLVSADYSQIELRVMAALSGDAGLKAAFARGADIHTDTATRVYGVLPGMVTPEMRSRCKMVNFGIIYGISAFGLSQRLGVPRKQAADLIEAYFAQYPGVKEYMDRTIAFAREHGHVRTELGRRRFLRDINSRNGTSRQAAERNAINTPVQGTAADLIKLAMVRIHHELRAAGLEARMVLQVHDELLFDVPRAEEPAVRALVTRAMCEALDLGVPLAVEIGSGANWLAAH